MNNKKGIGALYNGRKTCMPSFDVLYFFILFYIESIPAIVSLTCFSNGFCTPFFWCIQTSAMHCFKLILLMLLLEDYTFKNNRFGALWAPKHWSQYLHIDWFSCSGQEKTSQTHTHHCSLQRRGSIGPMRHWRQKASAWMCGGHRCVCGHLWYSEPADVCNFI